MTNSALPTSLEPRGRHDHLHRDKQHQCSNAFARRGEPDIRLASFWQRFGTAAAPVSAALHWHARQLGPGRDRPARVKARTHRIRQRRYWPVLRNGAGDRSRYGDARFRLSGRPRYRPLRRPSPALRQGSMMGDHVQAATECCEWTVLKRERVTSASLRSAGESWSGTWVRESARIAWCRSRPPANRRGSRGKRWAPATRWISLCSRSRRRS